MRAQVTRSAGRLAPADPRVGCPGPGTWGVVVVTAVLHSQSTEEHKHPRRSGRGDHPRSRETPSVARPGLQRSGALVRPPAGVAEVGVGPEGMASGSVFASWGVGGSDWGTHPRVTRSARKRVRLAFCGRRW